MAKKEDHKGLLIVLGGLAGLGGIVLLSTMARGEPPTLVPTTMTVSSEMFNDPMGDYVRITCTLSA